MKFCSLTLICFLSGSAGGTTLTSGSRVVRRLRETASKAPTASKSPKAPKASKSPKAPTTTSSTVAASSTTTTTSGTTPITTTTTTTTSGTTTTTSTTTTTDSHGVCRRRMEGFDETTLYESMGEFGLQHKEDMDRRLNDIIRCDVKESRFCGQYVTYADCIHTDHRIFNELDHEEDYEPWVVPSTDKHVSLLAQNPGIWTIENFLDEEEVADFLEIIYRNGNDRGLFGACTSNDGITTNAQVSVNKACFKMSSDHMCDGPVESFSCSHATNPKDGAFIQNLRRKVAASLSVEMDFAPYVDIQVAHGDTPPQGLHEDSRDVVTFAIYLSNGGAGTVFPGPDVRIVPRRGTAAVWVNLHENGSANQNAFHAVEPHPSGIGDRILALLHVRRSDDGGIPLATAQ